MVCLSHGIIVKISLVFLALCLVVLPVLAAYSWAGQWRFVTSGPTDMVLYEDTDTRTVTGSYSANKGSVLGRTSGTPPVFTGTWRWENGDTGNIEFRMSSDGQSFTCRWGYNADPLTLTCSGYRIVQTYNPGKISVSSTPSGAAVYVDNEYKGTTPLSSTPLTEGSHTLRVSLTGYETKSEQITISEGIVRSYKYTLTKNQPTTGSLSFTSTPSGAVVIIDGESRGTTPLTVSGLAKGSHSIRVTKAGYGDYEDTGKVTAGQTTKVAVTLSALITTTKTTTTQTTSSQLTGTGFIEVRSQPSGATISIDGTQKGATPAKLTNVKSGNHEITLTLAGYPNWKQTVTVKTGETASINAVLGTAVAGTVAASAAGTGSLSVTTAPAGAHVYLDGALIGNSPTTNSGLAPGSHTLLIKRDGYQDLSVMVTITAGQTTEYSSSLVGSTAAVTKRTPGFATVIGILAITCILSGRRFLKIRSSPGG